MFRGEKNQLTLDLKIAKEIKTWMGYFDRQDAGNKNGFSFGYWVSDSTETSVKMFTQHLGNKGVEFGHTSAGVLC